MNYFPYGKQITNATWTNTDTWHKNDLNYGFNGKWKDNNIRGAGGSLDFGARIFNTDLGIFLSRDPLANIFPFQSSYIYASNNPILYIDLFGESTKHHPHYYYYEELKVDMSSSKSTSLTSKGAPRNKIYYFKVLNERNPQVFSAQNLKLIKNKKSPIVDQQWVKHFPKHKEFMGEVLEHHHHEHGNIAIALPKSVHRSKGNYGILHNLSKKIKGTSGKLSKGLSSYFFLRDIFSKHPESFKHTIMLGMDIPNKIALFGDYKIGDMFFNENTNLYEKVTNIENNYKIINGEKTLIKQSIYYNTYEGYKKDKDGNYQGIDKKKTYIIENDYQNNTQIKGELIGS